MKFTPEQLEEFNKWKNRTNSTWDQVIAFFELDCNNMAIRSAVAHWKAGNKYHRKTPKLSRTFNYSFLNQRWNGGLCLAEYEPKPWHHPEELRDRRDDHDDFRIYNLTETDKRLLSGIDSY